MFVYLFVYLFRWTEWRMDVQGTLPADLQQRAVSTDVIYFGFGSALAKSTHLSLTIKKLSYFFKDRFSWPKKRLLR